MLINAIRYCMKRRRLLAVGGFVVASNVFFRFSLSFAHYFQLCYLIFPFISILFTIYFVENEFYRCDDCCIVQADGNMRRALNKIPFFPFLFSSLVTTFHLLVYLLFRWLVIYLCMSMSICKTLPSAFFGTASSLIVYCVRETFFSNKIRFHSKYVLLARLKHTFGTLPKKKKGTERYR